MSKPRLTEDSRAVKLLRELCESGKIKPNTSPAALWNDYAVLQDHGKNAISNRVRLLKKEYQISDETDDADVLSAKCSHDERPAKKRRTGAGSAAVGASHGEGSELLFDENTFMPLYSFAEWKDRDMVQRLNVAIVLPSGVATGGFSLNISDDGNFLVLTVTWPTPLADPILMHRKWLNTPLDRGGITEDHSTIINFLDSTRKRRERIYHDITCTARIPLPFSVQAQWEKENLTFETDSEKRPLPTPVNMLYIRLRKAVEEFAIKIDDDIFQAV